MTGTLAQFSSALAGTVAASTPYVVRVEGRQRLAASGIVWSADGLIVTSHHVLERDDGLRVGLASGEVVSATLVGRDPTTDIALLRTDASDLGAPALTEPDSLKVGHLVLALGRPGKTVRATLGIVSALGDSWRTPMGGRLDRYLQTDVVMYPGFSGGPLVDADGAVIGVNTTALLRGVNITIPVPTVRTSVESLLAHGKVRRGYLGVGSQPARLPESAAQSLDQGTGLLVVSVEAGSPAEAAGIFLGDTIVSVNDQAVRDLDDLLALLPGDQVGKTVQVRILRGGQAQELQATVAERP